MVKKLLNLGLIQPYVDEDNQKNQIHLEALIQEALEAEPRPEIICLPERWFYVDPLNRPFEESIQPERGPQYQLVQSWAQKYHISIISGGIWEWRQGFDRPFITSYYFNKKGEEQFRQDKIQLYLLEKKGFNSGTELKCFYDKELDVKFAVLICFDLNISSSLPKLAVANGCEIIFSPTLIREEGLENWGIYIKARALECRAPIISCNSVFKYLDRKFLGNSKIIQFKKGSASPIRLSVQEAAQEPCVLLSTVDLSFPNKIRNERLDEVVEPSRINVINL